MEDCFFKGALPIDKTIPVQNQQKELFEKVFLIECMTIVKCLGVLLSSVLYKEKDRWAAKSRTEVGA